MRVELKSLQPNPFRNFKVDPIDQEVVEALKASIKENPAGFWGGIVGRRTKNNGIQLAFGHHRVRAAIAAGIREDDIKVSEISDAEMIRMYANENATQRGNTGTALAGSVAAAIRFILKGLFTGKDSPDFRRVFGSVHALEQARTAASGDRGLGEPAVTAFLDGTPGINKSTVTQQLANLKSSGDYDEIIVAVKEEIEEENKEALRALARQEEAQRKADEEALLAAQRLKEAEERQKEIAKAKRAAKEEADAKAAKAAAERAELERQKAEAMAKLAEKRRKEAEEQMKQFDALRTTRDNVNKAAGVEREVTFDFEGVAKHLKNASHIDTFRHLVTGEGIKPYLPVNRQAALAKKLIDSLEGAELTSAYLRENIMAMMLNVRGAERRLDADEKAEILRKDWSAKAGLYQREFSQNVRGMLAAAMKLAEHNKKRPRGVTLHMTGEFKDALNNADRAIALIRKALK